MKEDVFTPNVDAYGLLLGKMPQNPSDGQCQYGCNGCPSSCASCGGRCNKCENPDSERDIWD